MALLGRGWQASAHLITLNLVHDLKKIIVFSPNPESRQRFLDDWSEKISAELIEAGSAARGHRRRRYNYLHDEFNLRSISRRVAQAGNAYFLRQAMRAGCYNLSAIGSADHPLERGQAISHRHWRRRSAIDSGCR